MKIMMQMACQIQMKKIVIKTEYQTGQINDAGDVVGDVAEAEVEVATVNPVTLMVIKN